MNLEDLRYTKDHEWILVENQIGTVGITDHAQHQLGDVVFVELPKVGDSFNAGEAFGSVESVKAVSELYCPVSGQVIDVNEKLRETPEMINSEPYGGGWMIKIKLRNLQEQKNLLSASEYTALTQQEKE
ncbi:MAG: glycine cleavage system protein GcvH [Acidobacteria bacterium]|nr:glycine cleavage system protein GcvH [Acidobacteriota bacterium]